MQGHATDTYGEFAEQNKDLLQTIPPPLVALNYYKSGDLYLFDQLQTGWSGQEPRRPSCANLYEVFINIRDDEIEHVKTMNALKNDTLEINPHPYGANQQLYNAVKSLDTMDFEDDV